MDLLNLLKISCIVICLSLVFFDIFLLALIKSFKKKGEKVIIKQVKSTKKHSREEIEPDYEEE